MKINASRLQNQSFLRRLAGKLSRITAVVALGLSAFSQLLPAASETRPLHLEIRPFLVGTPELLIHGPSGNYRIEASSDLTTWFSFNEFFMSRMTGGTATFIDTFAPAEPVRFYRAVGLLIGAAFHLEGPYGAAIAEALVTAPPAALETLGISFTPLPPNAIPPVADLASADRNVRVYTGALAALSVLAESIDHRTYLAGTMGSSAGSSSTRFNPTDLAVALIADLASGKLDGIDENGLPIIIGDTGHPLPEHDITDLTQSFDLFKQETSRLNDLIFESGPEGNLTTILLAEWNEFHWNSSDWR